MIELSNRTVFPGRILQAHYEMLTVGCDAGTIGFGGMISMLPSRGGAERWINSVGVGNFAEACRKAWSKLN